MGIFGSKKLGIIGGGQLGKMLLNETRKWDVYTKVIDPSPESPCKISCNEFTIGDLMDYDAIYEFGKDCDLITIEIEHVNTQALKNLQKKGVIVYPKPETIELIQNKFEQKKFYDSIEVCTSKYLHFKNLDDLKEEVFNDNIKLPKVWKSTRFGYDGKGVKIIKNRKDIESLPDTECIIEDLVDINHEISVIIARNKNGEVVAYPPVEMIFNEEANLVDFVISPSRIPSKLSNELNDYSKKIVNELSHVGLLAIEFFITNSGEILVNEMAPRPHNSGHFSIEGSFTNQFEQHLRAILNLPLGNTENKLNSIMINFVGSEGHVGDVSYKGVEEFMKIDGASIHLYGKKETKPNRKMGHATIVGHEDIETLLIKATKIRELIKVQSNKK